MKMILGVMTIGFLAAPVGLAFADDYMPTFIQSAADEKVKKVADGMGPEAFQFKDRLAEQRVNNWNQTMQMIENSYQATPASSNNIAGHAYDRSSNAQQIVNTVTQFGQMAQNFGNINTPNSYVANSDGSKTISQNGLPVMIQHKPVRNEFGTISYQDITMQYNEDRLMKHSETTETDPLGRVTHTTQDFTWTPDSKWYAGTDTNVYKNILSSIAVTTDHTGRTTTTEYHGLAFNGRFTTAFSETIDDSVYGFSSFTRYNIVYSGNDTNSPVSYDETGFGPDHLAYELHRTNITYNDRHQVTSYSEEKTITNIDGSKTTVSTEAHFVYATVANPYGKDIETDTISDRIVSSTMTTTVQNADGSCKTGTDTVTYQYDGDTLVGASGSSIYAGRETDWIQYTDAQGHILKVEHNNQGKLTTAWYTDDQGNKVTVDLAEVVSTAMKGDAYSGTSTTSYEIIGLTPMAKDTYSVTTYFDQVNGKGYRVVDAHATNVNGLVNNTPVVLSSTEITNTHMAILDPDRSHLLTRNITTLYTYDEKGLLTDASGSGTIQGWQHTNAGWTTYNANVTVGYTVGWGRPIQTEYNEQEV